MRKIRELIDLAHEEGVVELTFDEAVEFMKQNRQYIDELSVDFLIKDFGGYGCTECKHYNDECTHWVVVDGWEVEIMFDNADNLELESQWEKFALRSRKTNETARTPEAAAVDAAP